MILLYIEVKSTHSPQLFKQIVTKVVVNKEGMSELQRLSSVKPLLLLPTHRSYLDFILVTWLMYSYGIRTPIIAAGQVIRKITANIA